MRKPELLLPGGSLDVLKVAVLYGADAVYIGGESFGLRAKAKNFSRAEMEEGIAFAHEHGAKVYVTANIFAHDADLEGAAALCCFEFRRLGKLAFLVAVYYPAGVVALAVFEGGKVFLYVLAEFLGLQEIHRRTLYRFDFPCGDI